MAVKGYLLNDQNRPSNTASKRGIKLFLIFAFLCTLGLGYWIYSFDLITKAVYLIQGKDYSRYEAYIQSEDFNIERTKTLSAELNKLEAVFPDDGSIYFYHAMMHAKQNIRQILNDSRFLSNFAFYNFIDKPNEIQIPAKSDWQKALLYFRKSLQLGGLSADQKKIAYQQLAYLYFFGGPAYSKELSRVKNEANAELDPTLLIFDNVFRGAQVENWDVLESTLPAQVFHLWRAIHGIQTGNRPQAFTELNKIIESDDEFYKNKALYLYGLTAAKAGKKRLQLGYYYDINWETFLTHNSWFYTELKFLLLFYGRKADARKLETLAIKTGI